MVHMLLSLQVKLVDEVNYLDVLADAAQSVGRTVLRNLVTV